MILFIYLLVPEAAHLINKHWQKSGKKSSSNLISAATSVHKATNQIGFHDYRE